MKKKKMQIYTPRKQACKQIVISKKFDNLWENQSIFFKLVTPFVKHLQCNMNTRKHKQDHSLQHCVQKLVLPRWLRWQRIHLPMQEMQIPSLGQEGHLEEEMVILSSILAGRTVHGVVKSDTGLKPLSTQKSIICYTNTQ